MKYSLLLSFFALTAVTLVSGITTTYAVGE